MATKAKDATLKKEKKALSLSNPKPTASKSASNDKEKSALATNQTGKPTPNYLKPTFSSKPDTTLKYVKKSTLSGQHEDTTSQKPTLLRRRSFDKPPSVSFMQKTVTSLDPKEGAASRVRTGPLKSHSLSSNKSISITSKTGASDSFKPVVKSQPPAAASKPLKRSLSASRKNGISSAPVSSTTSPTKGDKTAQSFDPEKEQIESNEDSLVHDKAEKLQLPPDVLETDITEHLEAVEIEANNTEDKKLVEHFEAPSPTASEEQKVPQETQIEEVGELQNQPEGEENQRKEESISHNPEDGSPDEVIRVLEDDQNKEEQDGIDSSDAVSSEELVVEEHKQEEEDKNHNGAMSEEVKSALAGGDENAIESVAVPQEATGSTQKRPVGQGKKESPSAYNDVIEETKNKLLETRKNKVKALVGAFETVIDYESGSK